MDKKVSLSIESIQQFIDIGRWAEVENFIIDNHYQLFSQGLHKKVSYWISCLPEESQNTHPISLQFAYSLIPFEEEQAFNLFGEIYNQAIEEDNISLAFSAWTGLADCSFYNLNRFHELKFWLKKIDILLQKEILPLKEKPRNAFIAAYFNAILFCDPAKNRLAEWQKLAQSALINSSNPETRTLLSNHLILVSIWQGNMFQARLLSSEFLGANNLQNQNPLAFMVQKTMQAQVAWLNADKNESLRHVKEGLEYSKKSKIQTFDPQLMAQAVYACMVDNDFENAEKYLKNIEKIKNPHHSLDNAQYHYLRAWVSVSIGDSEIAYVHATHAVELTKVAGVEFAEAATRTLLAQIHFEKKKYIRALHHLAKVQLIGRHIGSLHIRYAGLLAQSWAMYKFNRDLLALHYLRKAFNIGAKQDYLHIPGWPFKIMSHLCEIALREDIETEYTRKIIRLHQMIPSDPANAHPNWPWKIEIKLFGSFKLHIDGEKWKSNRKTQNKPLEILKLLACYPKGIHQNTLADILWGDAEGDAVIQTLHTTLHRLRSLLKAHDAITLKNGLLCLNYSIVNVDIFIFEKLLGGKRLDEKRGSKELLDIYQKVDLLYAEGFLANETTAPWVIPIQENMKGMYLKYLYQLGELLTSNGEVDASIKIYQKIMSLDSCAEKSYQKLIQLYLDEGLNAEAVLIYNQCKLALKNSFGISPSEKTRVLISKL